MQRFNENHKKEPFYAMILRSLNSILHATVAWHVGALFNSVLLGIAAFFIMLLRDAICIASKCSEHLNDSIFQDNPSNVTNRTLNDEYINDIAQSEMPSIAFFNAIVFVVIRIIYVFH